MNEEIKMIWSELVCQLLPESQLFSFCLDFVQNMDRMISGELDNTEQALELPVRVYPKNTNKNIFFKKTLYTS